MKVEGKRKKTRGEGDKEKEKTKQKRNGLIYKERETEREMKTR